MLNFPIKSFDMLHLPVRPVRLCTYRYLEVHVVLLVFTIVGIVNTVLLLLEAGNKHPLILLGLSLHLSLHIGKCSRIGGSNTST